MASESSVRNATLLADFGATTLAENADAGTSADAGTRATAKAGDVTMHGAAHGGTPCEGTIGGGAAKAGAAAGSAFIPIPDPSTFRSAEGDTAAPCDGSGAPCPLVSARALRLATMPIAPPIITMTSAIVAHARVQSETGGRELRAGTRTG
jgi:hypothetical protein